jgi:DNA-binding HxlR family transcriptional regulator
MDTVNCTPECVTPESEALVRELLERVADKWTLLIIDALDDGQPIRFTRLREAIGDISQKMLTKTLRQLERDGLVSRRVHPVIPPHVDYTLTDAGRSLGAAVCGIWEWVDTHAESVARARAAFAVSEASVMA